MTGNIAVVALSAPTVQQQASLPRITIRPLEQHPRKAIVEEVTLESPRLVADVLPIRPKKKFSQRRVPVECEINHIPDNIGAYLVKMLPALNIVVASAAHLLPSHPDVQSIVNQFVLYFLDNDSEGLPRYKRYDLKMDRRPKYHHYVLSMSQNFGLQYRMENNKDAARHVGIQDYDGTDSQMTDPGRIHYSQLETKIEGSSFHEAPDEALDHKVIADCYLKASAHLRALQEAYRRIDVKCWQANCHDIFLGLANEDKLVSLAEQFGISRTSINKWQKNVVNEVRSFIGENPFA